MLSSPWMTPDVAAFRDQVRRFVADEVAPHGARWRAEHKVDRELWNKAGDLGMLLADVPDDYGGSGGTFAHMAVVFDELAAAGDSSFGVAVHAIVAHYLLNQGSEAQKRAYLPRLATGELVGAIAMTEPGAGSDLQGIRTTARRDGDHFVVNGTKTFITTGYHADLGGLVARPSDDPGAKGISLLLVETRGLAGYRVGKPLEKIGMQGQDTCELFFEDARVPVSAVLGDAPGRGFAQLMQELPYERLLVAIAAVASIERAVRLTVAYTRERKAFGKTLLDLQNTRFVLAEAKTHATIARAFVDRCIEAMIAGSLDTVTASMAKYWCTDIQCKVIDDCLQLFGGYGYMLEYPIAQMYADARVQRIYAGANEIMKELIARSL
ncbi:MAG: acyl-CoA dehydrogenase family protein [Myxococcota bacterium]